jgi:hypothetical protein
MGGGISVGGTGISCHDGSCPRIGRNTVWGLSAGSTSLCSLCQYTSTGVLISGAQDVLIERNDIEAGCSTGSATGMALYGVSARVQNNVVKGHGGLCSGARYRRVDMAGIRIYPTAGEGEFDVHSNAIDAGAGDDVNVVLNPVDECTSDGIVHVGSSSGIFRNNALSSSGCGGFQQTFFASSYAFRGSARVFEHNALFVQGYDPGDAYVYLDGITPLRIDDLNQLTTTISSGNFDGRCSNVGLPCIDAGTAAGAPRRDFNGELRDAMPDIGAVEN